MILSILIFFCICIITICDSSDKAENLSLKFPKTFKIGAATSSYQVEGAWNEDGKSPSIWDTFTHRKKSPIIDGSDADVSANSYHLFKHDIEALSYVGVSKFPSPTL